MFRGPQKSRGIKAPGTNGRLSSSLSQKRSQSSVRRCFGPFRHTLRSMLLSFCSPIRHELACLGGRGNICFCANPCLLELGQMTFAGEDISWAASSSAVRSRAAAPSLALLHSPTAVGAFAYILWLSGQTAWALILLLGFAEPLPAMGASTERRPNCRRNVASAR